MATSLTKVDWRESPNCVNLGMRFDFFSKALLAAALPGQSVRRGGQGNAFGGCVTGHETRGQTSVSRLSFEMKLPWRRLKHNIEVI